MTDALTRRSIVSNSLAQFLNRLRKVNSESLETIDKENYQFQVADSLTCAFEQIKSNLELKKQNLLISVKDKLNESTNSRVHLIEDLNEENNCQTDFNHLPINNSINSTISSTINSTIHSKINSTIINSEHNSFIKSPSNSKLICESSSFTSNNTLDSFNSLNTIDFDSNVDCDNLIQQSVDSGFSTLLSNGTLSSGIVQTNDKLQRDLNYKKDEQAFIKNLIYFLNLETENESTDNVELNDCLDNLPEQIALNLVKIYSKKEPSFKIDPNELDCWLVSEQDVPQKLLPIPNNVQFLTQHFNQTNHHNLISELDENEIDLSTTESTSDDSPNSKLLQTNCSESNPIDIKLPPNSSLKTLNDDNLSEKTTLNEDKLIDNERKLLSNNFLSTNLTTNAKSTDDHQDDMQKLNNLFHNGKFLNFTSLNNFKSRMPSIRGTADWAPPRVQIHTHIFSQPKRQDLISLLTRQNYRCGGCGLHVEKQDAHRLLYCFYTGKLFCAHGCHSNTKTIIPAYIINKWNFKLYPVSNFAFQILNSNFSKPLFNINDINPKLFSKVKQFQTLHDLRKQLLKLKEYICQCKKASNLLVAYLMFEPKHFCEATKDLTYSLEDLVDIKKDCKILEKCFHLVNESINHIKNCTSCSAHGFICELCSNNSKQQSTSRSSSSNKKIDILFPFEIGRVVQCPHCFACYHYSCWHTANYKCMKCIRIERRRSSSILVEVGNEVF